MEANLCHKEQFSGYSSDLILWVDVKLIIHYRKCYLQQSLQNLLSPWSNFLPYCFSPQMK